MRGRHLRRPRPARPRHAAGVGIKRPEIDVGAIFVSSRPRKPSAFEAQPPAFHAAADDAGADVRGIHEVMAERRLRILRRRWPMHERLRTERRRADEIRIGEQVHRAD